MRPTLTVRGLGEQLAAVKAARAALRDMRALIARVALPWWLGHMRRQFATSGSHGGSPWAPLERKYAAYKKSIGASLEPLRWSPGREQIHPSLTEDGHPLQIARSEDDGFVFGSNAPNLDNVMTGGVNPITGEVFPARDPFATTTSQRDELAELIELELVREFEAAGLTMRGAA
jgi:hypothetical protein